MQRTSLPYSARIWVPEAKYDAVSDTGRMLVQAAGGATVYKASGIWEGAPEPTHIVELFYGDEQFAVEPVLYDVVQALLATGEAAVLYEINGRRFLAS